MVGSPAPLRDRPDGMTTGFDLREILHQSHRIGVKVLFNHAAVADLPSR
jgi:hypothetical protein